MRCIDKHGFKISNFRNLNFTINKNSSTHVGITLSKTAMNHAAFTVVSLVPSSDALPKPALKHHVITSSRAAGAL